MTPVNLSNPGRLNRRSSLSRLTSPKNAFRRHQRVLPLWIGAVGALMFITPAYADNVCAEIRVYNKTDAPLSTSWNLNANAAWSPGPGWPASSTAEKNSDGSPPSTLNANDYIDFYSCGNGGWIPAGTGGSVNLVGAGTLTWGVPWLDGNGWCCNSTSSVTQTTMTPLGSLSGGAVSAGGNPWTVLFFFYVTNVPPSGQDMSHSFKATLSTNLDHVYVLGRDGNLWLEYPPFGIVPPPGRALVEENVGAFQEVNYQLGLTLVLTTDGKLWLDYPPIGTIRIRQQVDGNVQAFQALDAQNILVLGMDNKLWLEHAPFGTIPPARQQVDGNVQAFQALDSQNILVLGTDGNLWFEHGPFGTVPPVRQRVDTNVHGFQAMDNQTIIVLRNDRTLWIDHGTFTSCSIFVLCPPPPTREMVESNVRDFQAFRGLFGDVPAVLVLGTDSKLWLEHAPFGNDPPARELVDGNVISFQGLIGNQIVLVLGSDGKLWLENAPFGVVVPPARVQIDANVM